MTARPSGRPEPQPGLALFAIAFLASPLILVCWAAGCALQRATGLRRWQTAAAAIVTGALVVGVEGGPANALASHFSGLLSLVGQFGQPMLHLPAPGAFLWPQAPLAIPAGLLAASLTRPRDLAVPDPAAAVREARRMVRVERKARVLAAREIGSPRNGGTGSPPLGVSLGGDLPASWRSGRYVVLPEHAARLPELAIGQSGAGKSTYIGRRVYLAAGAGRQVIAFDGKGDRGFVQAVIDAYTAGWTSLRAAQLIPPGGNNAPTIHVFPDQPLDGWRGDAAAQVNRLLGTWQWSLESDWYKQQATLALRLACSAPGPPVDCMGELVRRMDPPTLARLWAKHPAEAALVKMLTPDLPSICIRLANLAAAIAGRFDGTIAIGECDLTIVSLPVMAHQEDAESVFRILMQDVGHWASVRKTSRPGFLIVDEFSAVSGGRQGAIHVMERGRSFGVPSLLAGQSYASLGSVEEADRIVSAANSLLLFASNSPDELARLGGSLQQAEMVWGVEDGRLSGRGSLTTRARSRVDANVIRSLAPGQCVLVSGGRAEKMQVLQAPAANLDLALPGRPSAVIRRELPGQPGRVNPALRARKRLRGLTRPTSPGPETPSPTPGEEQPPDDRGEA